MKKNLRKFWALATVMLTGFAHQATATHWQGSELTYVALAPNVYSVNLKLYRDCSGSPASTSAVLNIKSVGCNTGRNINMTQFGATTMGNLYCPQLGPPVCTTNGRPNYEEVIFRATVTFTAAEQTCPEWLISWSECCRPNVANFANTANNFSFYAEAMIKLGSGIANSSPQFGSLVVPYVNHKQPILLSSHATDPDGDSLVYSLEDPLQSAGVPIAFGSYSPSGVIFNSDSTKFAFLPGGSYSKLYPFLSYAIDWTLPMPITPVKKFMFDTKTGSIGFIPSQYFANTPSSGGYNKYVMVVQVDEYRKVNGVMTKIGYVRRDMFITVIDCGPNQNPNINSTVANGQPISENDVINLRPGTPLNFQFAASDGNAANVLTLTSDAFYILPGATFSPNSGGQPGGSITWVPALNDVRDQVYYFRINVMDDACPIKGYQTHTFGVRVSATGGVTGTNELTTLPRFMAYPNPFKEEVSFKVFIQAKTDQHLVIYNTLGQQVDKIALKGYATGEQTIAWKNAAKLANGQYVARLFNNQKETLTIKFSKQQ